jgi:hypothetical protein
MKASTSSELISSKLATSMITLYRNSVVEGKVTESKGR